MLTGRKWFTLAGGIILVAGLVGCASVQVNSDYDPGTDFSKYKTFSVVPMQGLDSITAGRVQSAVTEGLKSRGLQAVEGASDLKVVIQARIGKEQRVTTTGYGGYGWGYRGAGMGMSTSTVQDVPVGTLVVDLVDDAAKKLVWRGTATDTLDTGANAEQKQQGLDMAMKQLFANYPPAPKK